MDAVSAQGRESFFDQLEVPYGTRLKLERYAALVLERTAQVNLIAKSTIPALWQRHFWDSAQLLALLPASTRCLVDLGSGAGFPGLVLGLLGVPEVHLIESIGKKARFLTDVAAELAPNVTVHQARIETVRGLKADVVTARALTALPDLLSLAAPFMGPDSLALFLKGEKADAELTAARKWWTFACEKSESRSDPSGVILQVRALKIRHDFKRKTKSNG